MPPVEQAAELAERVREAVWGLGDEEPLGELEVLLGAGRFDAREADLGVDRGGHEALMFPGGDGRLLIRVDTRPKQPWGTSCEQLREETRRHRLRFRIAHEVAHSFFYERDDHGSRRRRRSTPGEERFCDAFAGALLLPAAAVLRLPPTAPSVLALHERFDVSVETAARRLGELRPEVDIAVAYWPESAPCTPTKLCLQWTSARLTAQGEQPVYDALSEMPSAWTHLTTARPRPPRRQVVMVGQLRAPSPSEPGR